MQISAVILALVACVAAVPAPAPAPAPVPQGGICFDDFDCGLGQVCSNLQCSTAPPGSPEAALASALSGAVQGLLPSGSPAISLREAEANEA